MNLFNNNTEIADRFRMNTIVSIDELANHDMIYIYHHLSVGTQVDLYPAGTNVKGDLRYRVSYRNFNLGFITIGDPVKSLYENADVITSVIVHMEKKKFLPIHAVDLSLQATKMKMVS